MRPLGHLRICRPTYISAIARANCFIYARNIAASVHLKSPLRHMVTNQAVGGSSPPGVPYIQKFSALSLDADFSCIQCEGDKCSAVSHIFLGRCGVSYLEAHKICGPYACCRGESRVSAVKNCEYDTRKITAYTNYDSAMSCFHRSPETPHRRRDQEYSRHKVRMQPRNQCSFAEINDLRSALVLGRLD